MKTKQELDKEWNTCRYCGITKEKIQEQKENSDKYIYNYVMNGECNICRDKRKDKSDFEEAKKEGEITRDDSIMCLYCGYVQEDDVYEYANSSEWNCPECNKDSKLSIESTMHFTTSKRVCIND